MSAVDPVKVVDGVRQFSTINRALAASVRENVLPQVHYGPERSELQGIVATLEKVCDDLDKLLRGEDLELSAIVVEL